MAKGEHIRVYNNGHSLIKWGWPKGAPDDKHWVYVLPWHTLYAAGQSWDVYVRAFEAGDEPYAYRRGPDDRLHEYTDHMAIAAAELVDG